MLSGRRKNEPNRIQFQGFDWGCGFLVNILFKFSILVCMAEVFLSNEIEKVVDNIDFSRLGDNIAVKLHFGEKGCRTFLKPGVVKAVCDKITSVGNKATLVECNVLYRGSRTNTDDHLQTAAEHGFDFAPIDILDGQYGQDFFEVDLPGTFAGKAKLGKGLLKYDSLIAVTHFTAHEMAGIGGVFKNLGMGLASRAGKLHMHSDIKCSIDANRCTGCGICAENCNADAIEIFEKARINPEKCIGCAMCIAICPEKAVMIPWHGSTTDDLQRKIVDYASAVLKAVKGKAVFINVLQNITDNCDCLSKRQKPFMDDIGILLSGDIVGIEKASLDLVNENSQGRFEKIHNVNYRTQIGYAEQKKLGDTKYKLTNI